MQTCALRPLPAFTSAMPSREVAAPAFCGVFFPSAGVLSPCTLLRSASIRLMTLPDFGAGSSCGTGRCWILASTISRSAASYWSVNFSGSNFAVLRLMSSLASESWSAVDRGLLDVGEIAAGLAQLFGIAHGVGDHAGQLVVRRSGDGDEMFAAAERDLAQRDFMRGLQGLAHHREGLGLGVVLGHDEVRLLVVFGIDFARIDELRDFDRVLRRDAQVLDLVGLDHDVLALAILVTLDDVVLLDRALFAFAGDLLVADALAGRAAELMEANLALRFGGGKEAHTEGDERNLYLTCPEGSRHEKFSKLRFTRRFNAEHAARLRQAPLTNYDGPKFR